MGKSRFILKPPTPHPDLASERMQGILVAGIAPKVAPPMPMPGAGALRLPLPGFEGKKLVYVDHPANPGNRRGFSAESIEVKRS